MAVKTADTRTSPLTATHCLKLSATAKFDDDVQCPLPDLCLFIYDGFPDDILLTTATWTSATGFDLLARLKDHIASNSPPVTHVNPPTNEDHPSDDHIHTVYMATASTHLLSVDQDLDIDIVEDPTQTLPLPIGNNDFADIRTALLLELDASVAAGFDKDAASHLQTQLDAQDLWTVFRTHLDGHDHVNTTLQNVNSSSRQLTNWCSLACSTPTPMRVLPAQHTPCANKAFPHLHQSRSNSDGPMTTQWSTNTYAPVCTRFHQWTSSSPRSATAHASAQLTPTTCSGNWP